MDQAAIDRVLACRTLPTLPGVALEVLDLTRDPKVPIDKIARLVQNDPALTTKILRTVNSSFYGLTNPCPTISRAVSLLGLNTVKSLVLGFSLVEMTGKGEKRGFDLTGYWRRTIYSAAGARLLARRTRACDPEEAFIGGLLQDVGMLAAHAALGKEYSDVLAAAPEEHDQLAVLEHQRLGFDHAEVGSLLAAKWKLPPLIVECTRRHHRPESAGPAYLSMLRLVALGTDAAATLSLSSPRVSLTRFLSRAADWFALKREEAERLLADIAEGASQLSSLLELKTGINPDVMQILADANDQLTTHQIAVEQEADQLQRSNQELARQAMTDALTGAANRKHFDAEMERLFAECSRSGQPLSVLFSDADRFKSVNDAHGHQAGDAVLMEISRRIRETVGDRGTVCRYGGEEFAVILPSSGIEQATQIAESVRVAIQQHAVDIRSLSLSIHELPITISIGVASTEREQFDSASQLVHAADEAVYAAKNAGRNCVRIGSQPQQSSDSATMAARPAFAAPVSAAPTPLPAPGTPGEPPASLSGSRPVSVLLVEQDPLAAKLLELMFAKRTEVCLHITGSAEGALDRLLHASGSHGPDVDVILCALDLPALPGIGLIRTLRADPACRSIPIVAMSNLDAPRVAESALAAGATLFLTKSQICSNLARWTSQVIQLGAAPHRAAA